MTIGKAFKSIVAGAVVLASTLAGIGQASARDTQGPALWKVADADTTIYLFGTVHALPTQARWRSQPVAEAIAQSDSLVLEILVDGPDESGQSLASLGITPGQPPLVERIPAEKRAALSKLVASSGIPAPFLDQMESWAAAITLASISFSQAGFSPDSGVEVQLTQAYRKANKPIAALETVEQQLGFLDTLPETTQRALLASAAEEPESVKEQLDAMLAAWIAGDVNAIATLDLETQDSPELRQALLVKRNHAWSDWIEGRLGQPGTVFIAVGAGHLAGKGSLQEMLERKGIKTQRVN